ncbi:MAG: hypothetical protein NT003_00260 [Candidatus Magasanikbacteria bacterium]|nr:hypothetical protein [Candidatus Magasanikbacteria bacterium]
MKTPNKIWLIVAVIVLLLGGVYIGYLKFGATRIPNRETLAGKADLLPFYDKAIEYEQKIKENPSEIVNYTEVGSDWKLIGDSTHDSVWLKLSLSTYQRGIEKTNNKNSLLIENAGQVAESIGDYALAETYYTQAIDLSPGDVSYYLARISLLKNKLHVSQEEILRAYDEGMQRVTGGADLVSSRAQYLKSVQRYDDARADFELLLKNKIITQEQFDEETINFPAAK